MPTTGSTPAAALKQATATAHQRTEKALVARIKGIETTAGYSDLLGCLYGFFFPLEKLLKPVLDALLPDAALRRKSARLLEDIRLMDPHFTPRFAQPPTADGPAAALGAAYVMEGSVLGGAVIKKIILARSPGIPTDAFGFFSGYGADNGSMWTTFLGVLDDRLESGEARLEGIRAAEATFSGMEKWIGVWYGGA